MAPKLKVQKYEGYRAAAAKRLQTPEYGPDEDVQEDSPDDDASIPGSANDVGSFDVSAQDVQGVANISGQGKKKQR